MTRRSRFATLASTLLILTVASAPGCSKSTNPGGGGGAAKELDSAILSNGGVYAHTFASAGTFPYHCRIHGSAMHGMVTVQAGGSAGAAVSIQDNSYNPSSVTIAPGTGVTWTHNGSNNHSVTSD
jgi:plastocyanin